MHSVVSQHLKYLPTVIYPDHWRMSFVTVLLKSWMDPVIHYIYIVSHNNTIYTFISTFYLLLFVFTLTWASECLHVPPFSGIVNINKTLLQFSQPSRSIQIVGSSLGIRFPSSYMDKNTLQTLKLQRWPKSIYVLAPMFAILLERTNDLPRLHPSPIMVKRLHIFLRLQELVKFLIIWSNLCITRTILFKSKTRAFNDLKDNNIHQNNKILLCTSLWTTFLHNILLEWQGTVIFMRINMKYILHFVSNNKQN